MKKNFFKYNGLVEKQVIEALREIAAEDCRALSPMVNKILKDYCREYNNDKITNMETCL